MAVNLILAGMLTISCIAFLIFLSHLNNFLQDQKDHNAQLEAALKEWEKLKDPVSLHMSILNGTVISLSRDQALHLAGATDYDALKAFSAELHEEWPCGLEEIESAMRTSVARQTELEHWKNAHQEACAAGELLQARIKELSSQIITGFWGDRTPSFRQGEPIHELEELLTADQVNRFIKLIKVEEISNG